MVMLARLYHKERPKGKWALWHILFFLLLIVIRAFATLFTLGVFLKDNVGKDIPRLISIGVSCLSHAIASYFQWHDGRWPTALAKIHHRGWSGLGFTVDIGFGTYSVITADTSRTDSMAGLLMAVAGLLQAADSVRLFGDGLSNDGRQALTWTQYCQLAWRYVPHDAELARLSLPPEVKEKAICKREELVFDDPQRIAGSQEPPRPCPPPAPQGPSKPASIRKRRGNRKSNRNK